MERERGWIAIEKITFAVTTNIPSNFGSTQCTKVKTDKNKFSTTSFILRLRKKQTTEFPLSEVSKTFSFYLFWQSLRDFKPKPHKAGYTQWVQFCYNCLNCLKRLGKLNIWKKKLIKDVSFQAIDAFLSNPLFMLSKRALCISNNIKLTLTEGFSWIGVCFIKPLILRRNKVGLRVHSTSAWRGSM